MTDYEQWALSIRDILYPALTLDQEAKAHTLLVELNRHAVAIPRAKGGIARACCQLVRLMVLPVVWLTLWW